MYRFVAFLAVLAFLAAPVSAEVSKEEFQKMLSTYLDTDEGRELIGKTAEKYFRTKQEDAKKKEEEKAAAEMESQFKNPVKIDAGASPIKGPADAKVTIIEFSDFQCPYCSRGRETMEEVLKSYPKDVRVVFKNLPLPFHKQAEPAARAALAAGKQGKFWEMHDAFFTNQKSLADQFYTEQAQKLGLNMEQFKKDMESEELKKQVQADAELAKTHGISGTPGFFVNGVAVKGAYPFEHFKTIIDRWLGMTKAG